MQHPIASGKTVSYREATEALHRGQAAEDRYTANYRMLWDCGLADLIRDDFYGLFDFLPSTSGHMLEAGCGTGVEAANVQRLAPGVVPHGVDISSVALAEAVRRPDRGAATFHQAALEQLPFAAAVFDLVSSHEVVEHVEDPAVVLCEFFRVLKPGGICVIATPNGASLWAEQLRQRALRMLGRRGAPVGEDHTRPPSFWRREFLRAGFAVERRMFDGAALEFQTYFAKASWMPWISRTLEPLRAIPILNFLLCDRVKFRLRKPGAASIPTASVSPCCPLCLAGLSDEGNETACENGHRFARSASGVIDFTAAIATETPARNAGANGVNATAQNATIPVAVAAVAPAPRPPIDWKRRIRRSALFVFGCAYAGFLAALAPLGLLVGLFYQPLGKPR